MKKYKNKKKKKQKIEKRTRWKLWMTIASVFLGVSAIAGATVLGVYLTGGFEEKIVSPESISFGHDENTYLEVEKDFELTITTQTKDVTENKVTLSFESGIPVVRREGKISNKIIEVPETVTIGKPFTVHLLEERLTDEEGNEILSNGNPVDWIVGGLSTLYATSESPSTINTQIKIAVDVPVYDTETIIINSNGEETTQVVTNESFTVKTKFIPAKSEFIYSDNLRTDLTAEQVRVKHTYYEAVNTDKVTAVYDDNFTMHFVAGEDMVSENVGVEINSYTFINASTQIQTEGLLSEVTDPESYHQRMLEMLVGASTNKNTSAKISIGEASIGNFTVAKNKIDMKAEQPLRLYMNEYNYQSASDYLGVNIYSTPSNSQESGRKLDNLLSNIAISFTINGKDVAYGDNKVLNVVGGDVEGRYVDINGMRYYKPNAEGTNLRYSYWDLTANNANEITMNIVLLVENETTIFKIAGQEIIYTTMLSISKHEEQPLAWTNQEDLEIMLDYDAHGNIEPYALDLNALVNIPQENIYKDYVFFASFGSGVLSEYIDLATSVFGADGFDLARSGIYSTNSGNLSLFAIDRSTVNLYDSASFSLYYATIKTENGQPIYNDDNLYQIAIMCAGNKRIICEKALYTDSVDMTKTIIDTSSFATTENDEVFIPQGTEDAFSITFTVSKESVTVFRDEFQQGFMTPIIKDQDGNDISSYFIIDDGSFLVEAETGEGKIKYNFTVKPAVTIENANGIFFGYVSLNYNDKEDKNITWESSLENIGEKPCTICIYKPLSNTISLDKGVIYDAFKGNILVKQTLNTEGDFDTTITAGEYEPYTSISSFLNDFIGVDGGAIIITDQKGNTQTLSGQWKFVVVEGDASVIGLSADNKSFVFKNTDSKDVEIKLAIQTIDENAILKYEDESEFDGKDFIINFIINSTGITSISYDTSIYTFENSPSEKTTEIASASVSKYGAKSRGETQEFIVLSDLLEFYVTNNGEDSPYEKVSYRLNPQYILEGVLSNDYIIDLYGANGMISLYTNNDESSKLNFADDATAIRTTLLSTSIYKIKINKDFAIEQTLHFIVSDEIGAVNTNLSLNLLANVVVSSANYPISGETLYAGDNGGTELSNNSVTNKNYPNASGAFATLYNSKVYFIVYNSGNDRYELTEQKGVGVEHIGTFYQGKVTFVDFWDVGNKSFTVFFQPEGDNLFAINHVINFVVTRDLLITPVSNSVFYVLGASSRKIDEFVKVTRATDTTADIPREILDFTFDDYLLYTDTDQLVTKNIESEFFFDYNQKVINSNLYVKLKGQSNENALKVVKVNIELFQSEFNDIYLDIANSLSPNTTENTKLKAKTQVVGDVEYVMFDLTLDSWVFGSLKSYEIRPIQKDYYGNPTSIYKIANSDKLPLTFQTETKKTLFYGLGDKTKYITLKFYYNGTELAIMHLPIILSNLGYNTVVYDEEVKAEKDLEGHELETALTNPEILLEKGIYNKIEAGKVAQILKEISYDEIVTKGGLYTLSGTIQYLNIYSLTANNNEVINATQITKENSKAVGYLTLNHLSSKENNVYIAFEYILEKSGNRQSFYYLLKVEPDVQIESPLYAYDGNSEYISGSTSEYSTIDLEATFANTTLHSGYKRFNVSKNIKVIDGVNSLFVKVNSDKVNLQVTYGGNPILISLNKIEGDAFQEIKLNEYFGILSSQLKLNVMIVSGYANIQYNNELLLSNLVYMNEIVSVQVGEDNTYTNGEWSNILEVSFSSDYRYMTYRPLINEKMIITLKHSYTGNDSNLKVIGGDQSYSFILNETAGNYTVRFTKEGAEPEETANYVYKIKNSEGSKIHYLDINLIKNEMAGSSLNQTIEYNKLDISITSGRENLYASTENNASELDKNGFTYDKATGKFVLKTKEYIESDKEVVFTIYIEQGYLATMTIKLKANTSFVAVESVLTGGTVSNFVDLFNIYHGDQIEENKKDLGIDYSIISTQITGDIGFVNWNNENNSIEVADLLDDKVVTFTFTIDFGENKTFIFSQTFDLKANVKAKTSYVSDDETIAGSNHIIDTTLLYEFLAKQTGLSNTIIDLSATSSSSAFAGIENNVVSTNFVAESVTVELTLTVALTFEKTDLEYPTPMLSTQYFTMTYTFSVIPSVKLKVNYPVPNSEIVNQNKQNGMDFEFVEDGAIFADIISFIQSNPIFGNDKRVVFNNHDESTEITNLDKNHLSIIIAEKDNATLNVGEVEVGANAEIDKEKEIVFNRGGGTSDATIIFRVTYQEVSVEYIVKILKNSLTVVLNPVTNNLLAGEYEENSTKTTVSYEKIYVDKTSPDNLFAKHRMVYVEMNDDMTTYANEYYLIFKDENNNHYASRAIYFNTSDQGKNLYFDLGVSMQDYKFVGAFLTSDIEKLKWNVTIGSPIITGTDKNKNDILLTEIPDSKIVNYANGLFDSNLVSSESGVITREFKVKLANRVQMVYGQIDGKDILVDYDKYSNIIIQESQFSFSSTLDEISKTINITPGTFNRNDGSINRQTGDNVDNMLIDSYNFTLAYYYMPALDVAVKESITSSGNYIQVEVNQEYMSLVSLLGIVHPSTNRTVAPSNFMSAGDGLEFTIVTNLAEKDLNLENVLSKYKTKYDISEFKISADSEGKNIYIFSSGQRNSSNYVCDYSMIPFGAKNTGDFVLGKLVYSAGDFTKTFYVVIKIIPDYIVTYGESSDNKGMETDSQGEIVSNLEHAYRIAETTTVEEKVVYKDFTLLGKGGYLSVTHKNGSGEKQELSASDFEIEMVENKIIDSQKYNDSSNISNKLFYNGSDLLASEENAPEENLGKWHKTTENTYAFINKISVETDGATTTSYVSSATFSGVNEVIFGNQYYMLQGEDDYGYRYRLYFLLQATKQTPVAQNSIEIVEDSYFDIGVQYQLLSISSETSNDTTSYHINPVPVSPTPDEKIPLVILEGIEAWIYDKDYTSVANNESESQSYLSINEENGYTANVEFSEEDSKYLSLPDLKFVSISDIKFYAPNSDKKVLDVSVVGGSTTEEDSELGWNLFATSGDGKFNGMEVRSPYTLQDNDGNINEGLFKIGKLSDTDLYGSANTASVTMLVTLKYQSKGIIEYYNCPVNVVIRRDVSIIENQLTKVQRDGQAFDVASQFDVSLADDVEIKYLNDTLEVLVPNNSTVTFEMTLNREGLKPIQTSVTVQNSGSSHARTKYLSLSQYFSINVNEGDTITISNCSNPDTKFYYVMNDETLNEETTIYSINNFTGVEGIDENNNKTYTFTISQIRYDAIYVEDASLIEDTGYYGETKYYVLETDFGNENGATYYYRATRNYTVTGIVYKLAKNYSKEIGFAINSTYTNGAWSSVTLDQWRPNAFTLQVGKSTESGAIESTNLEFDDNVAQYLRYSLTLDESDDTAMEMGKAEIDSKTGTISLDKSFTIDQYIKIIVRMGVSGPDRTIGGNDTTYLMFDALNLSTVDRT